MKDEKNPAQELREKLFAQPKHAALRMSDDEISAAFEWCEGYKTFLSDNRTEREITAFSQKLAEARGFEKFDSSKKYSAGDKVWFNVKEKAIILGVFGTRPLSDGVKIAAAHIDSPRLDVKPNPMYEDCEIALFKTHYYGGIKKYQWPTVPLSLHGVIIKADGEKITVSIGDKEGEPQFVISDLLPHLDSTMGERKASQVIKGEELNVLIGSMPFRSDEGSDLVKLNILKLLNAVSPNPTSFPQSWSSFPHREFRISALTAASSAATATTTGSAHIPRSWRLSTVRTRATRPSLC